MSTVALLAFFACFLSLFPLLVKGSRLVGTEKEKGGEGGKKEGKERRGKEFVKRSLGRGVWSDPGLHPTEPAGTPSREQTQDQPEGKEQEETKKEKKRGESF